MVVEDFEIFLQEGIDRLAYLAQIREHDSSSVGSLSGNNKNTGFRRPTKAVAVKPFQAITYGSTSNNRREFSFFQNRLQAHGLDLGFGNLADQATLQIGEKILNHHSGFLLKLWQRIEHLNIELEDRQLTALHVDYCRTFFRSFFFFSASLLSASIRKTIPFALVSNDHAPMPVAFAQVCRAYGIPIGYIQHAEINEQFPPLAFDFAILNNSVSLDIYENINSELPPAFILPRFESVPKKQKLGQKLDGSVGVGLFLTSLCDFDRIGELVNAVKSNPLVSSVCIQPHPRTLNEQMHRLRQLGVPVGKIELDEIQVAVCQNTSSVIELLHHGLKTLQIFEYDLVPDDHYGFVKKGVVPALRPSELAGPFWNKFEYSSSWETNYSQYNPSFLALDDTPSLVGHVNRYIEAAHPRPLVASAAGGPAKTSVKHFARPAYDDVLKAAVSGWVALDPKLSIEDIASRASGCHADTKVNLDAATLHGRLKEAIHGLYVDRDPAIVAWMNQGGKVLLTSTLGVWSALYSRFWTSSSLTDAEFEFFQALKDRESHVDPLFGNESLLFCLVVRRNDLALTRKLLGLYRDIANARLDIRARTDLGRHLFINRMAFPEIERLRSQLLCGLSGLDRLRIEIIGCARPNIDVALTHKNVEEELIEAAGPALRKELKELVLPTFEKHRNQLRLMEVFWNESQRKDFYKEVTIALQQGKPFSFVRLSDGEGWIFSDGRGPFTLEDEVNREKHWWGCSPSAADKARVRSAAFAAVSSADILGIPSIYRILQSLGSKSTTLMGNVTYRGLLQVLIALRNGQFSPLSFSDEKANIPLFWDISPILEWCETAEKVVVISSVRPEIMSQILGASLKSSRFDYVEIPTHFRTRTNPMYCSADFTLPEKYTEIEAVIGSTLGPGVLLLNAAGVAGKGFNGVGKAHGAVAIDLGGAVDIWLQNALGQ